jgi:cell wall assembly regulator SMI1
MSMIESMDESARVLTTSDVLSLEHKLGLSLPVEYKNFLLRHNGGRPTPRAFPIVGLELNPFGTIQVFFGIDDPIECCNIDWNYKEHNGRIPPNLLPIACDDGSDLVCLALAGADAGAVFFWDGYDESDDLGYSNLYLLADSFDEFIKAIQELPDSGET